MAVFALLLVTSAAFAQRVGETVEVTIVEVPVTVHDRNGKVVRGLTAEHFEITVDGKRVPIEYFEALDLTKIAAVGTEQRSLPPVVYRNFLLMLDLAHSSPGVMARAQEAARQFVETQVGERDLVAVATYTHENGAQMVTGFTRDREFLHGAIATLGQADFFRTADPFLLAVDRNALQAAMNAPRNERSNAEEAMQERLREHDRKTSEAAANENRGKIRTQIQNLGGIARALDRLKGQKQIILLSEGFDARLITGRDDLSFKNTQAENDAVLSGEIWKVDSDQRFGSASESQDINAMAELFRRSDVRLHAIDIKGVRSEVDAREGLKKSSNESLFLLTRPTGGTVLRNGNDLSAQFAQLLERQEVVYLLGFRPKERGKAGEFHPVRVRLTNGAKGEVSHRTGYYDAKPNALETNLTLAELLMSETEVRDVPVRVVATPVPGAGEGARVPVVVEAQGAELLQGLTGANANANIYVYAFDPNGIAHDFLQQRVALDLTKTGAMVRGSGMRYVGALRLPPGDYVVKALVRVEDTGRTGFTTTRIAVPKYGASVVVPPMVAGDAGQWLTIVSPSRGSEATGVFTLGERPFIPSTRLDLKSSATRDIALMVRGISVENLAITPMLVAPDGSAQKAPVTLTGRTSPDEHGLVKLLFRFTPEAIAKGEYELRFTIVPAGGRPTVVGLPVVIR
jgi:VWFA-related protein